MKMSCAGRNQTYCNEVAPAFRAQYRLQNYAIENLSFGVFVASPPECPGFIEITQNAYDSTTLLIAKRT